MRTLKEYNELPILETATRDKLEHQILETIIDNPEAYLTDIAEMVGYFIAEMSNADFIRLCDQIKERK